MKSFISLLALGVSLSANAGQYRGYERFEYHLKQLDKILKVSADTDETIDVFVARDVRKLLFKLEGLARIYRIQYEEFDPIYEKFKKLEDVLGKYLEAKEYFEFADKIRAPESAVKKLKAVMDENKKLLAAALLKTWMPDKNGVTGAEDMMEVLYDFEWDSDSVDRKLILDSFKRDIKKVIENNYDMDQLQAGVHELRRRLRWFSIYLMSTDGMIGIKKPLDEKKIPDWEKAIKKMDWSGDENPFVSLTFDRYSVLSYYISFLGELKDQGEYVGAVLAAMGGSAESKKWILSQMEAIGMPVRDVHKEAKALYAELKKNLFLEGLYKELTPGISR